MEWIARYWVEFLFGLIVAMLSCGYKTLSNKISQKMDEQEAIKMGIQALLRDRIIQSYNIYKDKGYCPVYARDNIENMYKQYHELGGNGTVTDLVETMRNMNFVKEG